jgi:hypothetical protein
VVGGSTPLSIYVHIPFCESVCYYCACNKVITRHHERAAEYLDALDTEIGLVQAALGDFRTGLDSVKFQARADTLIFPGPLQDSVAVDETVSDSLTVRIESFDPAGVLPGRSVIYTIVEPVFATPADRTVEFPNAAIVDTVTTGAEGTPSPVITLGRRAGFTSPDSAIVEARAFQARGTIVPGSGQRFVIHFD